MLPVCAVELEALEATQQEIAARGQPATIQQQQITRQAQVEAARLGQVQATEALAQAEVETVAQVETVGQVSRKHQVQAARSVATQDSSQWLWAAAEAVEQQDETAQILEAQEAEAAVSLFLLRQQSQSIIRLEALRQTELPQAMRLTIPEAEEEELEALSL